MFWTYSKLYFVLNVSVIQFYLLHTLISNKMVQSQILFNTDVLIYYNIFIMKLSIFIVLICALVALLIMLSTFLIIINSNEKIKQYANDARNKIKDQNNLIINTTTFKKLYKKLNINYNKEAYDNFWVQLNGFKQTIDKNIEFILLDNSIINYHKKRKWLSEFKKSLNFYFKIHNDLNNHFIYLINYLNTNVKANESIWIKEINEALIPKFNQYKLNWENKSLKENYFFSSFIDFANTLLADNRLKDTERNLLSMQLRNIIDTYNQNQDYINSCNSFIDAINSEIY